MPCAYRVGLPRGEESAQEASWGSASNLPQLSDSPPSGVGLPGSCHGDWLSRGPSLLESAVLCEVALKVSDFATSWTAVRQAPLFKGPSGQEYCTGLLFPSPGDLPNPRIKPKSTTLWADSLRTEPRGTVGSREKSQRTDANRVGSLFVYKLLR